MNGRPGWAIRAVATALDPNLFIRDFLKGSYYANPLMDDPIVSAQEAELYPEYYGKNICERYEMFRQRDFGSH